MIYRLSRRQQKELDRGNAVNLVIPTPWYECDPADYFRRHTDIPPAWIVDVGLLHVTVLPRVRGGDGLAGVFGEIVRDHQGLPADAVTIQVEVIHAMLCRQRHGKSEYPDQWPGRSPLGVPGSGAGRGLKIDCCE